jgi:hypothetical protein
MALFTRSDCTILHFFRYFSISLNFLHIASPIEIIIVIKCYVRLDCTWEVLWIIQHRPFCVFWVSPLRRKLDKTSNDFFLCCYQSPFPPCSLSGVLEKLWKCKESRSEIIHILKSWAVGYTSSHRKVYGLPMLHSVRSASCTDKVTACR